MDRPTKRDSPSAPFAVFAGGPSAGVTRRNAAPAPGSAGGNPQALRAADSLVGQAQPALGAGDVPMAESRARESLGQVAAYMPALLLLP
jgi:hypothetical protein